MKNDRQNCKNMICQNCKKKTKKRFQIVGFAICFRFAKKCICVFFPSQKKTFQPPNRKKKTISHNLPIEKKTISHNFPIAKKKHNLPIAKKKRFNFPQFPNRKKKQFPIISQSQKKNNLRIAKKKRFNFPQSPNRQKQTFQFPTISQSQRKKLSISHNLPADCSFLQFHFSVVC